MNKDEIFFVIPAFNEGKQLGMVIKGLQDSGFYNLIIVDDGSNDNTSEVARDAGSNNKNFVLLRHVINRGQGASLGTGIEYARKVGRCRYIVTFDSDGQHRISDLGRMIKRLEKGDVEIVLGSRFLNKKSVEKIPVEKRILLRGALIVTWFLSNLKLTDTHNGYRVMTKEAARKICITMDGFEHASEILDEISRKRIPYAEVPVTIDYTQYSKEKGQRISNSIKIFLKMLFK